MIDAVTIEIINWIDDKKKREKKINERYSYRGERT